MIGQFFDTIIVASSDTEWLSWPIKNQIGGNSFEPPEVQVVKNAGTCCESLKTKK